MSKLFKTILLVSAFLLIAGNGWALSIKVNDIVTMTAPSDGENYLMYDINDNALFHSFCLEKREYFNPNSPNNDYTVSSIGMVVFGGGKNLDDSNDFFPGHDPVSSEAVWLYASYFDGVLGERSVTLANQVQNAIWYAEDEFYSNYERNVFRSNYDILIAKNTKSDFTVTGWDIQAVNLVDSNGDDIQSQLVGAPLPEPTTMLLFGTGLIGLAGVARRRSSKK